MRRTHILAACAVAVALVGITQLRAVEEAPKEGKATVRSVHGKVEYQTPGGAWAPLRPNTKFTAGTTIRTGADGVADISVNGISSALRLTNNTTVQIPTMSYVGTVREGDTTTMLNLLSGSIVGNVKKITANSRYEIMTPHGVAGIRGTDFGVEAIPTKDGKFHVTFNSITGVITVSAMINGVPVVRTLTTGTSWEIGESVKQMKSEILTDYQTQIMGLVQSVEDNSNNGNSNGNHGGGNNNNGNNNNNDNNGNNNGGNNNGNGGIVNPVSPFPGGTGQPQGGSSS